MEVIRLVFCADSKGNLKAKAGSGGAVTVKMQILMSNTCDSQSCTQ